LRQAVARTIPRQRIRHPDVIDRRELCGLVQGCQRDIDLGGATFMAVGQRRAAVAAE
jgi:hypothetical protein